MVKDTDISVLVDALSEALGEEKARLAVKDISVRYSDIYSLFEEAEDELEKIPALGKKGAEYIKLLSYITARRRVESFRLPRVLTEEELIEYIRSLYIGQSIECVYILLFDERNRFFECVWAGDGTVVGSDIYPRRLTEIAMKKNARSCIIVHNHPKGKSSPSMDDIKTTNRLASVFRSTGVYLRAHYIVAGREVARI